MICPIEDCPLEVASVKRLLGGVTRSIDVDGAGVAGRMGISLIGCVAVQVPVLFPVESGVGKKCVYAGIKRQVTWMVGDRIVWIRSWLLNASCPLSLAMRTSSTGYLASERSKVASSDCLCASTKRMCPTDLNEG